MADLNWIRTVLEHYATEMILLGNRYEDITPTTGAIAGPSSCGRRRGRHFAASGLVEPTATNHDAGEPWWGWGLMRSRRANGKWFGSIMARFSFFFQHHSIHSYTKSQSNKWNYGGIMNLREFSCRSLIWKWRKFSNSGRRAILKTNKVLATLCVHVFDRNLCRKYYSL